jgi:hypothetical protein
MQEAGPGVSIGSSMLVVPTPRRAAIKHRAVSATDRESDRVRRQRHSSRGGQARGCGSMPRTGWMLSDSNVEVRAADGFRDFGSASGVIISLKARVRPEVAVGMNRSF